MRIHFFQHAEFETPGSILKWAKKRSFKKTFTRFYLNESIPPLLDLNLLVVLGGPMSVHDEDKYPWLVEEKRFLRSYVASGRNVLGICLGAQLLAEVMGAKVHPGIKEIGYWPIRKRVEGLKHYMLQSMEEEFVVFHWHCDAFDNPSNACPLFESNACKNQAFATSNVLALQFHLEITEEWVKGLVENCKGELKGGDYVQSETMILAGVGIWKQSYAVLDKLLDAFVFDD